MKKKRIEIFIFTIIISIISSIILIQWFDKKLSSTIMNYSTGEMKQIISIIINRSINSDLFTKNDMEKLYIINKNENKDLLSVTLDSVIVNRLADKISDACEDNLRLIENNQYDLLEKSFNINKNHFFVPSGLLFGTSILANIGPKIPITMKMIGNVTSGVVTDIKEYGINNSLITISISISVEMMVILPFNSDYISVTNDIPISIKMIQGKVPEFYGGYYLK